MGGTPHRMETFARSIMKEIGHKIPTGTGLVDISKHSHRYVEKMYIASKKVTKTYLPTLFLKMSSRPNCNKKISNSPFAQLRRIVIVMKKI